jgi:glyoxylase-like metal-dependent hydrolase (beta-lactamase superfamily II)
MSDMGWRVVGGRWCEKVAGALAAAALVVFGEPPVWAQDTIQASEWRPLSRALTALGAPPARRAASEIAVEHYGTSFPVEQGRDPVQPTGTAGRYYRWHFDAVRQRMVREAEQRFPGGIRFWSRIALAPTGGWNVDLIRWRTGTDLQPITSKDARESRLEWERFLPHLLLAQAAQGLVEPTGPASFRFTDASGARVEVELDPATLLPRRAAQDRIGQPRQELIYSDYRRRHGVMLPGRMELRLAGRLQEELQLGRTRLAALPAALLEPPGGYAPPPAPGEPRLREIAPGVLYFENMPGDYHSLAVDLGDHVAVVEAPLSPAYAELQRTLIGKALPGKPVRFVFVTHHHGDHTGGLSTWAAQGATVIVAKGARTAIERQLSARRYAGRVMIEEVADRRTFGEGAVRLVAHAASSSHNMANLLIHLPVPRLLFQGDFFYVPERGPVPPPFPIVGELRRIVEERGLAADRIIGVHGRIGTREELQAFGSARR